MNRTAIAVLAAVALAGAMAGAAEFRARLGDAALKDADRTYPRVSVQADWCPTQVVGASRYRVAANTVTEVAGPGESDQRRASVSEDYHLRWLGAAEGVAFLAAERDVPRLDLKDPESFQRFHRLDLDSMKWLEPFNLPEPSISRYRGNVVQFGGSTTQEPQRHVLPKHLLVTPKGVVVLCEETIEEQDRALPDLVHQLLVGYHVSFYAPAEAKAKWDRTIRHGRRARRTFGWSMWSYDASIERLAYVSGFRDNDLILVCPGERDPVVCLAAADGKVRWRIPAIWEYERGFIGPSVFEHYIERFGLDSIVVYAAKSPVLPDDEEEIDREQLRETVRWKIKSQHKLNAAREAFDARYQGCITAGPIVVPDADGRGNPRAYVAAVRSLKPDDGSVQQPEHALLFEIELNGSDMDFTALTFDLSAMLADARESKGG